MALAEEPERPGVFTFTWFIHNFSHCKSRKDESLSSPTFYVGSIEMYLSLYPKGYYSGFMSLFLDPVSYETVRNANDTIMYVLSLKRCNGTFKDSTEQRLLLNNSRPTGECRSFISIDELNELDAYLEHDILTIRCRVWRQNASVTEPSVDCFAKTEIKIAKLNYLWILDDLVGSDGIIKNKYDRKSGILKISSEFPSIKIHVCTGESFDDDAIYLAIEIQNGSQTPLISVYNIHLLDSNGCIAHSIGGKALFRSEGEIQKYPILSKRKLLSNKELYLSGGKLTLQCKLSFSGNLVVKCVEYGKTDDLILNSVKPKKDSFSDGHELWRKNMRQFYSDGEFTDLLVCTPNQKFPVHRAILCAQSEVFRGMLTHDMKEKNSGVIEITDFDDDTVSKLLLYLYTNTLEDIDYVLAKDLYFAADKYRISPLQEICSNCLIASIDNSNACEILLLSDQLRDQELKSTARNLIVSSPYEIMNSSGWKNLMETNSQLTSETMQWMIFNNFLTHKK